MSSNPSHRKRSHNKLKQHLLFDTYIRKILKKMYPEIKIKKDTLSQINAFVNLLGTKIMEKANNLVVNVSQNTISSRTIQSAVKIIFSGELAKHAVSEGVKVVGKYIYYISQDYGKHNKSNNKSKVRHNRTDMAGIYLSISRIEHLIRNNATGKKRVSGTAAVYFAAVLDYIVSEIIELACKTTIKHNKKTITARYLYLSLRTDYELSKLIFDDFTILGGGFSESAKEPDHIKINKRYSNTDKPNKNNKYKKILRDNIYGITDPGLTRLMRRGGIKTQCGLIFEESRNILMVWLKKLIKNVIMFSEYSRRKTIMPEDIWESLPTKMYSSDPTKFSNNKGIKSAKKDVAFYQKTSGLLLQKLPFERLVREVSQEYRADLRITEKSLIIIQNAAEQYLVNLYNNAKLISENANRKRVTHKDLQLLETIQN